MILTVESTTVASSHHKGQGLIPGEARIFSGPFSAT